MAILEKRMAPSPNYAVPASRQENGRSRSFVPDLVSSQAEQNATDRPRHATTNNIGNLLFELGIEPSLTVQEAAGILRWSYWKARRYFSNVDGICVSYRPKRYKRPYRMFTIPVSIFAREWQKMTGQEPEDPDVIRHRLALVIPK